MTSTAIRANDLKRKVDQLAGLGIAGAPKIPAAACELAGLVCELAVQVDELRENLAALAERMRNAEVD